MLLRGIHPSESVHVSRPQQWPKYLTSNSWYYLPTFLLLQCIHHYLLAACRSAVPQLATTSVTEAILLRAKLLILKNIRPEPHYMLLHLSINMYIITCKITVKYNHCETVMTSAVLTREYNIYQLNWSYLLNHTLVKQKFLRTQKIQLDSFFRSLVKNQTLLCPEGAKSLAIYSWVLTIISVHFKSISPLRQLAPSLSFSLSPFWLSLFSSPPPLATYLLILFLVFVSLLSLASPLLFLCRSRMKYIYTRFKKTAIDHHCDVYINTHICVY